MTAIPTVDLPAQLADVLERVRQGESVLLTENGRPVAQVTAAPAESAQTSGASEAPEDEDERPWRGVFAMALPKTPVPNLVFPDEPVVLKRWTPTINLDWFPKHDDAEE